MVEKNAHIGTWNHRIFVVQKLLRAYQD